MYVSRPDSVFCDIFLIDCNRMPGVRVLVVVFTDNVTLFCFFSFHSISFAGNHEVSRNRFRKCDGLARFLDGLDCRRAHLRVEQGNQVSGLFRRNGGGRCDRFLD